MLCTFVERETGNRLIHSIKAKIEFLKEEKGRGEGKPTVILGAENSIFFGYVAD